VWPLFAARVEATSDLAGVVDETGRALTWGRGDVPAESVVQTLNAMR